MPQAARIIWTCALLGLLSGYCFIGVRYQHAVDAADEASQGLAARASANERIIAQTVLLRVIERRVDADLSRVHAPRDSAASTAALLFAVSRVATRFHSVALAVEPASSKAPQTPANTTTQSPLLAANDVDIHLRGNFRNLLACIEELSHHGVLLSVSNAQFALSERKADSSGAAPKLETTVHATLYRLARTWGA